MTRLIFVAGKQVFGLIAAGCLAMVLGAGFSLEAHAQGAALWISQGCDGCHGAAPVAPQRNAADMAAVIDYAITQNYGGQMGAFAGLSAQQRADLATYIGSVVPANSPSTGFNTPISVSVASHITLATGTFTSVAVVSGPSNGTTGAFVGTNVTYTPNPGYFGPDSFTYRATGPAGNSSTRTVAITVGLPGAPAAAAKAVAVGFNTATAIDLTASITGVTTGIAVASGPAHGTTSVNGNTVTYTPTNGYSGPDSFTYTASGPGGTSTPAIVSITVGTLAPAGGAATITVPLNTPTTVDLATFITGSSITGIVVVAPPSHGAATVNGTRVTYTPANNYFGPDSFTYSAFGNAGVSPAATVSVTVVGRPDPSKDAAVVGLIAAQADAALRFTRTQISNFQRRMESLRRSSDSGTSAARSANADTDRAATARPAAAAGAGQAADDAPAFPNNSALRVASAAALPDMQGGAGLKVFSLVNDALSLLTTRSVNLASLAGAGGSGSARAPDATSFWIDGNASFGTRDPTGTRSGLDFSTSGISVGADRRFGDRWALGIGAGFARDKTDIGNDGSQSRAHGYSVAAYGSYQPTRNLFVDGLIGVGALDIDTRRFVAPVNDVARADRKGHQVFGSLAAGYEHRDNGLIVSPYARLDYSADRLNQVTETGAGQYALTYFRQTTSSVQGALGLRAESIHTTSFGWAAPRMRVEFRHEFQRERLASLAYADLIGGPRFAVSAGAFARNALAVGIGSDFVRRDGLTFGIDYQLLHSFSQDRSHAIRLSISKELDGPGSTSAQRGASASSGTPLDIAVNAGYMYDDNVTRSKVSADKLSDQSYSVNVSKGIVIPVTDHMRALLSGFAGGEKFRNYGGLSRIHGGVQGELQYRASAEFSAPTFALFGRSTAEKYDSERRDGYRNSIGISVRQTATDRIHVFGALAHNERHGDSAVFVNRDNSARVNLDWALMPQGTLYLGAEYRRGDIVSTGRPTLEDVDIAKVLVADDAFPGRGFFSYKFEGKTVLTTLGYNLGFGARDSLDFSWRRAESTPSLRPSFATSASSYIANQFSIAYLTRF